MKIQASVQIQSSPDKVWSMLSEPAMMVLWQSGYESTVITKGEPGEVGSVAHHVFKEKGKTVEVDEEILSSTYGSARSTRLTYPVMNQEVHYEIKGNDPTTLNCSIQFDMKAFSLRIMWPWLKKSFQEKLNSDLDRLKQQLEGQVPLEK